MGLLFCYLKKCYIIVMNDVQIVLGMRYNTLDLNFLPVISVRVTSRNAQLNCPAINVVQRPAVVQENYERINCETKKPGWGNE